MFCMFECFLLICEWRTGETIPQRSKYLAHILKFKRAYMPTHVHTQLALNVQLDAIYAMTICLCVRSMTIQHGCDAAVVFGSGGHSIYRCGRCLRQGRMPGMSYYMCKYVSTCVLVSSSV